MHNLLFFYTEFFIVNSLESSLLAFEKSGANVKYFTGGGVWMTKAFMDFWRCGHWMHFCVNMNMWLETTTTNTTSQF